MVTSYPQAKTSFVIAAWGEGSYLSSLNSLLEAHRAWAPGATVHLPRLWQGPNRKAHGTHALTELQSKHSIVLTYILLLK